ncbi:periplasmic oligopeptide-binding protein oppA [Vibrio ishigakensis]|uniref:Periplasmic oligopeptide-binding protein oppA n=1 Tax=Vibrio ishigakensis TaxID=1481914 RepID=A0A0B8P0R5_9VIBR|nr:periplasmic oligopeptide-binding protein oppA [Vibrio ishigakensis]
MKNVFFAISVGLLAWLFLGYQAIDKDNTLVIGGPFEFTSQDLSKDGYIYTRLQVAESLYEVQPDGALKPKLARSSEVSSDGLIWRFKIRDGVRFHNGQLLDADSVVTSLNYALQKPGVLNQIPLKNLYAEQESVVLELSEPFRPLLAVLSHFSAAILAPGSFDAEGQVVDIQGTGLIKPRSSLLHIS